MRNFQCFALFLTLMMLPILGWAQEFSLDSFLNTSEKPNGSPLPPTDTTLSPSIKAAPVDVDSTQILSRRGRWLVLDNGVRSFSLSLYNSRDSLLITSLDTSTFFQDFVLPLGSAYIVLAKPGFPVFRRALAGGLDSVAATENASLSHGLYHPETLSTSTWRPLPVQNQIWRSALAPGWGQWYGGRQKAGLVYGGVAGATALITLFEIFKVIDLSKQYDYYESRIDTANAANTVSLTKSRDRVHSQWQFHAGVAITGFTIGIVNWMVATVDPLFFAIGPKTRVYPKRNAVYVVDTKVKGQTSHEGESESEKKEADSILELLDGK